MGGEGRGKRRGEKRGGAQKENKKKGLFFGFLRTERKQE